MTPPTDSEMGRLYGREDDQDMKIAQLAERLDAMEASSVEWRQDMDGRVRSNTSLTVDAKIAAEQALAVSQETLERVGGVAEIVEKLEGLGNGLEWTARKAKVIAGWLAVVGGAVVAVVQAWQHIKAWFK